MLRDEFAKCGVKIVNKKTELLALILCLFMFLTIPFTIVMAQMETFSLSSKIDSSFPVNIFTLSKKVPVIIELSDDPVVSYSLKQFNNKFYFKETYFNSDYFDKNYEFKLIETQNKFLDWMRNNEIYFNLRARCSYVINSLSVDIRGWDIPGIIKHPKVKMIHDDSTVFYPYRAIAAQTTGAFKVWKGEGIFF